MLTLDVDKAVAGGRMLARHDGQIVLVAGAIPGERVVARVERRARGVLHAEVVDVLSASPDRRQPSHDASCGGQAYAHIAYERQLQLKGEIVRDAFQRLGKLPLSEPAPMAGSPERGYRLRARLHADGSRIGFYREGTHTICDPRPGGQLSAGAEAWIDHAMERLEASGLRGLTAIELAENIPADQRICHLELQHGADPAPFAALAEGLDGLSAQAGERGQVVELAGTPFVSDVLRVAQPETASTPSPLSGRGVQGLRLRRSARAFFQGNRYLVEPLAGHVLALVPAGPVVDLYAGVGLFGLLLAAAGFEDVTMVEGDPIAASDLADNAEPFADRVHVKPESVESFLSYVASGFSRTTDPTVIVDPPRTGLSKAAMIGLLQCRPRRIVYVSCDPATLARDARSMVDGGFELRGLSGFDLFPNTAHVEAIAVFERGD
jgi:23S rRNA (uracil1939-C5)-methyltransferase